MNEPSIFCAQLAPFVHVASSGGRMLVYGVEHSLEAARERASHARSAFQALSDQVLIARVLAPATPDEPAPRLSFVEGWVRIRQEWRAALPPHLHTTFRELEPITEDGRG